MRVFIDGATGFIGSAVAQAFTRAGHHVLGLTRSKDRARDLARTEIEPVVGDLADTHAWSAAALSCHAAIHCAVEYGEQQWELDHATVAHLLALAAGAGRPRLVVYTSGVWIYGDTGHGRVTESDELDPPPSVAPRVESERAVLGANAGLVRTQVLRPGCVYGGSGSLTARWFETAARDGAAEIVGDGQQRWAMVHRDDLGDFYVRAVESERGGDVFNATDRSRSTVIECARAASQAAGGGGQVIHRTVDEAHRTLGPMARCLAMTQHVDSSKAVRVLGWQPRHGGFVDDVARYHAAWRASRAGAQGGP